MIAATTTQAGLKVRAAIDDTLYPKGVKVSDTELDAIQITPDTFHGEWNYVISPKPKTSV